MRKADIDDESLERLAKGLGNGVTTDMIKAYNHEDTISYIINNYSQTVQNGGTGTLQDHTTFAEGSAQIQTIYNYAAGQAFEALKEIAELKTEIMRLRMKYESDAVDTVDAEHK